MNKGGETKELWIDLREVGEISREMRGSYIMEDKARMSVWHMEGICKNVVQWTDEPRCSEREVWNDTEKKPHCSPEKQFYREEEGL